MVYRCAAAGALLPALLSAACSGPGGSPPSPRLVLLYATCALNKQFLSPYNDDISFTPALKEFAREALVFRRHQTESGQSGIAYASILTGTQADHHGIFYHPMPLKPEIELVGEHFQRHGYDVFAWLAHEMASEELGYAQGAEARNVQGVRLSSAGINDVLERMEADESYKAFIVTAFTVTHAPYDLGSLGFFCENHPYRCGAWADRKAFRRTVDLSKEHQLELSYDFPNTVQRLGLSEGDVARLVELNELVYQANVAYLDQLFGEVIGRLRERGLFDDSLVVFTADHGETLFREGTWFKWTHGHQLAPEVLDVPLLIHGPGVPAGVNYERITRSIDLFPTLAGLSGLAPPTLPEGSGLDLTTAILGREEPPRLRAFSHTILPTPLVIDTTRSWRLFSALYPDVDPERMWVRMRDEDTVFKLRPNLEGDLEPVVYDLSMDPWELHNEFDPADATHASALRDLQDYKRRLIDSYRRLEESNESVDPATQEKLLRELGYIP